MPRPKTAVVVGATNGIGRGIACRLAREGFQIIAVGRDREGRKGEVLGFLEECSSSAPPGGAGGRCSDGGGGGGEERGAVRHEFRPCDAFELSQVRDCAEGIVRDRSAEGGGVDALVMTQGMATIQGFTPTSEGNDEKLTLHFWSRAAFAACLLPALRAPSVLPGGAVVMSVLSGGVHSPYARAEDPELKRHYSIKNAANFAGFYNDLFFDELARRQPPESNINFVHAAPGFVASNWGTEMPVWLRGPIRGMQRLGGKTPEKCAGFMVRPILACAKGGIDLELPMRPGATERPGKGLYIMKEDGSSGKLTKGHTVEAMEGVWDTTTSVLGRAGIEL